MTEDRWLRCADPVLMLDSLREGGAASGRRLRLFAAACCRRAWHRLDADGRAVIEASERFAAGLAGEAELMAAVWASRDTRDVDVRAAVDNAAVGAWRPAVAGLAAACGPDTAGIDAEWAAQADLLRDIVGPQPFHSPRFDTRWRTPLVLSLAQAAYDGRVAPDPSRPGWRTLDPARLLVLADALEEAGCTAVGLVEHLRVPGEHVRGCWALDVVLGCY